MKPTAAVALLITAAWLAYVGITGQSAIAELQAALGVGTGSARRASKRAAGFASTVTNAGGNLAGALTGPGTALGGAVGSSSGTLTGTQVARLALDAGLAPEAAAIAVAIAWRESRFVAGAHNPVPPDDSYGLWQINRLAHAQHSPTALVQPAYNAQVMAQLSSRGTNWRPWQMAGGIVPPAGLDLTAARGYVASALAGARA